MDNTTTQEKNNITAQKNSFDYSKAEMTMKNINIPGSQFEAKWKKDEGYAVGIEGVKLTKDYETLEQALNKIGYGVDKDKEGDEILVKVGDVDFELIANIVRALIIVTKTNDENGKANN